MLLVTAAKFNSFKVTKLQKCDDMGYWINK